MSRYILSVCAVCSFFFALSAHAANYAVFIGINEYEQAGISANGVRLNKLDFAVADVSGLKNALTASRFLDQEKNVRILTAGSAPNLLPSRQNILTVLKDTLYSLTPNDTVLIAFAGHGVSLIGKNELSEDFLCCSDTVINSVRDYSGVISIFELEQTLEDCRAGHKILILDACRSIIEDGNQRSVSTANVKNSSAGTEEKVRGFAQVERPSEFEIHGFVRLSSCKSGELSFEGVGDMKNGVFTHYLINGLTGEADKKENGGNSDGIILLEELFNYASFLTKGFVKNRFSSAQSPQIKLGDSSRLGVAEKIVMGYWKAPKPPVIAPASAPRQQATPPANKTQYRSGGSGGGLGQSGSRN